MRQRRTFGTIRKLPSGRFQASYIGPDERRHVGWSTYLVKGDAEAWLRDEELLTDRPWEWTPPSRRRPVEASSKLTLRGYAEATVKRRSTRARKPIRPSTVELYLKLLRLVILPKLGDVALVDLTPELVHEWYDALPADRATQNGNAYQLLRSILSDAVDAELIDRNPCRIKGAGKPEAKRVPAALTAGELAVYAVHAGERATPLLLAAWCGLRSGEVRGLRRCDVADDGSRVRIDQAVSLIGKLGEGAGRRWEVGPPKTSAGQRTVTVPPHLRPLVVAWLNRWRGASDSSLLFPAKDGSAPLNPDVLRRAHKRAAAAINRPAMTVHDLRRTGATLASQSGATLREVMRMLGHTQPGVAMLYQVAEDARDAERAERMSALTGWTPALPAGETPRP